MKPYVLSFCRSVVPNPNPVYVEVRPTAGAQERDCFSVVAEQIRTNGGEEQIGWIIWEWPKVFLEAEFHSVWRQPDGELLDITPHAVQTTKVLFLPDPRRRYEGRQVDNRRHPLSSNPKIRQFIACWERRFKALNKGEMASYHGEVVATEELCRLHRELEQLEEGLVRKYGVRKPGDAVPG